MAADGSIRIDTKIDQSGMKSGLDSMQSSLESFAGIATGIFAGISVFEFGKAALKSTADIELAQTKLETLLGSADRAQSLINDIVKMADTTPYNSNDLIQAATTLKSFGIAAADIMPTLTALGNAAGGQADNLKGVSLALSQTYAQGKMMGQDMLQFVNAGVPILELLSKRLNKSKGEIKGMIEQGKIGYAEVNGALQEFYTGNGKYANLMAKAALTLPGMYSTMQDSMMSFGRAMVASFEPAIKKVIQGLTDAFTAMSGWVKENAPEIKRFLAGLISPIATVFRLLNSGAESAGMPIKDLVLLIVKWAIVFVPLITAVYGAATAWRVLNTVLSANPIARVCLLISGLVVLLDKLKFKVTEVNGVTEDQNTQIKKQAEGLVSSWSNLGGAVSDFQRGFTNDSAQIRFTRNRINEFARIEKAMESMTAGTDQWNAALVKAEADYAFLQMGGAKNDISMIGKDAADKIKRTKDALDALIVSKKELDDSGEKPITEVPFIQAEADKRRKIIEGLIEWEAKEILGGNADKIQAENQAFADELAALKDNQQSIKDATTDHNKTMAVLYAADIDDKQKQIDEENARYQYQIRALENNDAAIELEIQRHNKNVDLLTAQGVAENKKKQENQGWFTGLLLSAGNVDQDIYDALKKDFHYPAALAFELGVGIDAETAAGIDSGLYGVVESVKGVAEGIADTFEAMMEIFDFGASILNWITDFSYADTETAITKYIKAIGNFFQSDLGSLSILFDTGASLLTQMLDGMTSNLPAIAETLGGVIQHITDYIAANGGAIVTQIVNIISAFVGVLVTKLPVLVGAVSEAFLSGITQIIPLLPGVVLGVINAIIALLGKLDAIVPALVDAILSAVVGAFNAIVNNLGTIISSVISIAFKVVDGIVKNLPMILSALIEAIPVIVQLILQDMPADIIAAMPGVIAAIVPAIIEMIPLIMASLPEAIVEALVQSMVDVALILPVELIKQTPAIIAAIIMAFVRMPKQLYDGFASAGKHAIEGLIHGLVYSFDIWTKVKKVFVDLVDSIKNFLGIHSPSTVFYAIGVNCVMGLIGGIKSLATALLSIGSQLVSWLVSGITSTGSVLWDAVKKLLTFDWSGVLSGFKDIGSQIIGAIASGITGSASAITKAAMDTMSSVISKITGTAVDIAGMVASGVTDIGGAIAGAMGNLGDWWDDITPWASGTDYAPGGMSLVGEEGPELINLPRGSQVIPADKTAAILRASNAARGLTQSLAPTTAASGSNLLSLSLNIAPADVVIDGNTITKVVFKGIDKQIKAAYGSKVAYGA